jgi:hypothetical protein
MHIEPLTSNSLIVNVYVNRYTIESIRRNSSRRHSFRSRVARESDRRARRYKRVSFAVDS